MLRKVLILTAAAAIAVGGGSLIRPFRGTGLPGGERTILRGARVNSETLALVRRACQNCHSRQTEWPWYGYVPPVSWLLNRDVEQARRQLDLSRWQDYSVDDRIRLLSEIGSAVRNDEMPIRRYLLLHREARLTVVERQQIYSWTRAERTRLSRRSAPNPPNTFGYRMRSSGTGHASRLGPHGPPPG